MGFLWSSLKVQKLWRLFYPLWWLLDFSVSLCCHKTLQKFRGLCVMNLKVKPKKLLWPEGGEQTELEGDVERGGELWVLLFWGLSLVPGYEK